MKTKVVVVLVVVVALAALFFGNDTLFQGKLGGGTFAPPPEPSPPPSTETNQTEQYALPPPPPPAPAAAVAFASEPFSQPAAGTGSPEVKGVGVNVTSNRDTTIQVVRVSCSGTAADRSGTYYVANTHAFTLGLGTIGPLGVTRVSDCFLQTDIPLTIPVSVPEGAKPEVWVFFLPTTAPSSGQSLAFSIASANGLDSGTYAGQQWECLVTPRCSGLPVSGPARIW